MVDTNESDHGSYPVVVILLVRRRPGADEHAQPHR